MTSMCFKWNKRKRMLVNLFPKLFNLQQLSSVIALHRLRFRLLQKNCPQMSFSFDFRYTILAFQTFVYHQNILFFISCRYKKKYMKKAKNINTTEIGSSYVFYIINYSLYSGRLRPAFRARSMQKLFPAMVLRQGEECLQQIHLWWLSWQRQ